MGLMTERKIYRVGRDGKSKVLSLPMDLVTGDKGTIAADRIFLADLRGEIPKEELHELLEEVVEPTYWEWQIKKKKKSAQKEEDK